MDINRIEDLEGYSLQPAISVWRRQCEKCGEATQWHFSALTHAHPKWTCQGCGAVLANGYTTQASFAHAGAAFYKGGAQ